MNQKRKFQRVFRRDGSANATRLGVRSFQLSDLYHSLLAVSWTGFLTLVVLTYLLVNLVFAWGYYLCGPAGLSGTTGISNTERMIDSFFFSVQTLATIGYGKITPVSLLANSLVTIEALVGLLGLAMVTGLLFSRFSRPTARVIFSRIALVTSIDGVPCLIFRMANARQNQIVDARVDVTVLKTETTQEGETYRNFYDLKLERERSPLFALTWTVVHPILPSSPLHGMTRDDLLAQHSEIVVSLTGIDGTFSQTIHARYSYTTDEILWEGKFADIIYRSEEGNVTLDLTRIHDVKAS